MIKEIGSIKLDYSNYSEKISRSRTSIDDEILEYVKNNNDSLSILKNDHRWATLYHFSPIRQSILEWYDFDKNEECLEFGSDCGAITCLLTKRVNHVDCVEPFETGCLINAYRNNDCNNISIYVSDIDSFSTDKKYKYITLIGVLDNPDYVSYSNCSCVDLLIKLRSMLKPDGRVLIAVDNKYGLKNWSGHADVRTGRYFDSIVGTHNETNIKSFTKKKLENTLKEAGFGNLHYYYPVPDYRFPTQLFSDENQPKNSDIVFESITYDKPALNLFDENAAMKEIIEDGLFPIFANSFFVEAGV